MAEMTDNVFDIQTGIQVEFVSDEELELFDSLIDEAKNAEGKVFTINKVWTLSAYRNPRPFLYCIFCQFPFNVQLFEIFKSNEKL